MKRLILASGSPRRKKIFEDLGLDFEIIKSPYEEVLDNHNFTYEKIENLAYNKAYEVAKNINYVGTFELSFGRSFLRSL